MRRCTVSCLGLLAACAPADPAPFWEALARADAAAARQFAPDAAARRCADALARALADGARAAVDEWVAIGADAGDARQRDWARRMLLTSLRHEGAWDVLATLPQDHPELELSAQAVPAAVLAFPRVDAVPPDAPVHLPWLAHASELPIVAAQLRGARAEADAPVVLDTGAGTCVITDALAERLGARFVSDAPLPVFGVTGERSSGRAAVLAELRLGAFVARDVPVAVVAAEHLRAVGDDITALVGWDVLRHVVLELCAQRREIVVDRSRGRAPGDADLVLLTEPLVRMHCGDEPLLLLLDTGSTFSHVGTDLVARLGLATRPGPDETLAGVGGEVRVATELVARLALRAGTTEFELADLPAHAMPPQPPGLPRLDGMLGGDVLAAFRVVVDGPAKTCRLRAP